jgi:hypothetical protein
MLVDEQFRRCVTFLYVDSNQSGGVRRPVGSVFFVGLPALDDPSQGTARLVFAVTARHVIDGSEELWLRMRTNDGGYEDVALRRDAWVLHPTSDVAVALMPVTPTHELRWIGTEMFATREFVAEHGIGEGDDVFFSGLFIGHYGKGVPQPIIRFGNVALMPREPVKVEISKYPRTLAEVEAYLVEARSWGGQSGSPAFLTFSAQRHMGGDLVVGGMPPFALLGLVQGIWTDPQGAKAPDPSGEGVIEVNMGISVVIPAWAIMDLLLGGELAAVLKKLRALARMHPNP